MRPEKQVAHLRAQIQSFQHYCALLGNLTADKSKVIGAKRNWSQNEHGCIRLRIWGPGPKEFEDIICVCRKIAAKP